MQDYHIVFFCAVLIIIATGINSYRIYNLEKQIEKLELFFTLEKKIEGQGVNHE